MKVAVGIPSYREADTIADVVRLIDEGLTRLPAGCDSVIVNVDGESDDDTVARFIAAPTRSRKISIVSKGQPAGKGRNIRELLAHGIEHGIDAMAMVDADVRTVTPAWALALLGPVISGEAHFVVPDYLRSRYRGTVTNHFAYPIVYGWLGADMRQPIGGDFGLSRSFVGRLLSTPWAGAVHGYGIDIFMSGSAVTAGVPWSVARLGEKADRFSRVRFVRIATDVMATGLDLVRQSRMTIGPLPPPRAWRATFTQEPERPDEGDVRRRNDEMRASARDLLPVYARWVGDRSWDPEALLVCAQPRISSDIWTRLLAGAVIEAAGSDGEGAVELLAGWLVPVLWMRSVTFWRDVGGRDAVEIDREVRDQAVLFRQILESRAPGGGHGGKPSSR